MEINSINSFSFAPSPYFISLHYVIYRSLSKACNLCSRPENGLDELNTEMIHDLMDCLHNVPEFLVKYNEYYGGQKQVEICFGFIDDFTSKWGSYFNLRSILDEALAHVGEISSKDEVSD